MHLLKDKLALGTVAACALLLLLPACSTRGDAPDPMHVDLMSDTPKEVPPPSPPPPDIKSLQEQSDTASVTKGDDTTPAVCKFASKLCTKPRFLMARVAVWLSALSKFSAV